MKIVLITNSSGQNEAIIKFRSDFDMVTKLKENGFERFDTFKAVWARVKDKKKAQVFTVYEEWPVGL